MGYSVLDKMSDRQYLADTIDDLINIRPIAMGDTCLVIETNELYMVNSKKEWVLLKKNLNDTNTGSPLTKEEVNKMVNVLSANEIAEICKI